MIVEYFLQYAGILAISFAIAALFGALAYMIGSALRDNNILGWAKLETWQTIFSGILLIILIIAWPMMVEINNQLAKVLDKEGYIMAYPTAQQSRVPVYLQMALNFLNELYGEIGYMYMETTKITAILSPVEDLKYEFFLQHESLGGFFEMTPCRFYSTYTMLIDEIQNILIKLATITIFQAVWINFIIQAMPFFVVAGFILRTLGLTRRLGGLMMAIGLMLYFVFPMFYVFGGGIYHALKPGGEHVAYMRIAKISFSIAEGITLFGSKTAFGGKSINKQIEEAMERVERLKNNPELRGDEIWNVLEEIHKEVENKTSGNVFAWLAKMFNDIKSLLYSLINFLSGLTCMPSMMLPTADYTFLGVAALGVTPASEKFYEILATLSLFTSLFAYIAIMATIAGIKSLSPLLGGDVEIAGLTHFI